MEFLKEKSTKLIGMPAASDRKKKMGTEHYFRAGETVVLGGSWGDSSTSYTGVGYSTSSYSCGAGARFTPENQKDYEMSFGLFQGENGRAICKVLLSELIPDPSSNAKIIEVNIPVERVALYDEKDQAAAGKCALLNP